jgi:hypothetical protein
MIPDHLVNNASSPLTIITVILFNSCTSIFDFQGCHVAITGNYRRFSTTYRSLLQGTDRFSPNVGIYRKRLCDITKSDDLIYTAVES